VISGLQSALQPEGTLLLGAADVLCGSSRRPAEPGSTAAPKQRPAPARRPLREPLRLEAAVESSGPLDPLDVETRFLRALGELESGEPLAAAASLRHVLYLDPTFGLAAFTLGRAHEATGDLGAARRAYQQALRTIDVTDERHDHLLEQVDLVDVATACRARYANL
jgi:tetratricopeptide (TPR) repeat protein